MKKFVSIHICTIGKVIKHRNDIVSPKFVPFYRQNLLPDFISVTIPDKDDFLNSRRIIVEIINIPIVKPFLGGFVNKLTGKENKVLMLIK